MVWVGLASSSVMPAYERTNVSLNLFPPNRVSIAKRFVGEFPEKSYKWGPISAYSVNVKDPYSNTHIAVTAVPGRLWQKRERSFDRRCGDPTEQAVGAHLHWDDV